MLCLAMLPGQSECTTHRWWGLLQALQEVHHLGLLFHVFHFLETTTEMSQAHRRETAITWYLLTFWEPQNKECIKCPYEQCCLPTVMVKLLSISPAQHPGWQHLLAQH